MSIKVKYVDLSVSENEFEKEYLPIIKDIFRTGHFVGGDAVEIFEDRFAKLCGTNHAVAINSGTDALILALKALGIGDGDEVITVSNSFIATANAIEWVGAKAVFADINKDFLMDVATVEPLINERTKAIMPVHLTGLVCDMDEINAIADKHGLKVIEDAAQSVCSEYKGKKAGSLGYIGCFSLHPLKNLSGIGDGGIVSTNHKELADKIRMLRNNGMKDRNNQEMIGTVSRLDTLNAGVLTLRLDKLQEIIDSRRSRAKIYRKYLNNIDQVRFYNTEGTDGKLHTYHVFMIEADKRDELAAYLLEHGVETKIHYPTSIHNQPPYYNRSFNLKVTEHMSGRILSLPISSATEADIKYTCNLIESFYQNKHDK